MTRSILRLAAVVTALLVLPAASAADSIPDTVERWGLLGTWATDCSRGPGQGPNGRKRTMTNHDTKGAYTVKNGKFLSNDSPTPWMTRSR